MRAVLLCLLTASLLAQSSALAPAIKTYEDGNFRDAKSLLGVVLEDPALSPEDRSQARLYLAASMLELGETDQARAQLILAIRERRDVAPDPMKFVPALIQMHQEEKTRLAPPQLAGPPVEATSSAPARAATRWWIPAAVSIGVAGVGGYLLWQAKRANDILATGRPAEPKDADAAGRLRDSGKTQQIVGIATVVVGLAGAGVFSWLAMREDAPAVSLAATPHGAFVSLQGTLP